MYRRGRFVFEFDCPGVPRLGSTVDGIVRRRDVIIKYKRARLR